MFSYILEMICIAAFALSGVMVKSNRGKDIISVLLLSWVTALGGGTLRDIILNAEQVFWIRDSTYFWVALGTGFIGFFLITEIRKSKIEKMIIVFDTIGVAMFTILVTAKLYATGYSAYVAVVMGMITAVFGGVIRDILSHRLTMFNNTDLYATPVILGGCLYIGLNNWGLDDNIASITCMLFIVVLRLYVIAKHIRFPAFLILK